MFPIVNATRFDNRISAIIEVPGATVYSCPLFKNQDGDIVTFPPTVSYSKKNGETGYDKVVVFKDIEAANKQASELYEANDPAVKLFEQPSETKMGLRLGFVTLKTNITLKVTVLMATEDKPAVLKLPKRVIKKDDKNEELNLVWPFTTKGEELKAEIQALTEEIIKVAKDYVPAEKSE